jgi:hypothetical protein
LREEDVEVMKKKEWVRTLIRWDESKEVLKDESVRR